MKKIYTLLMMLATMPVLLYAQGNPIEGYTEFERDRYGNIIGRYRYELTYDKDGWRKTEYVYYCEKEYDKWQFNTEELYDIGTYSYEFDTQGRVKVKAVTYEMGRLDSYRILADYTSTPVKYTKYVKEYDTYNKDSEWTCHNNGAVAIFTNYDYYTETSYYSEAGEFLGNVREGESLYRTGSLNDSTFIRDHGKSEMFIEHYRYDEKTGRLAEYSKIEEDDEFVVKFEYDKFGRISKAYNKFKDHYNDYEDEVTYTYFNDEYYSIGNSWRDVFFFEGPVAKVLVKENGVLYSETTFIRDAQGKLLSVEINESNPDNEHAIAFTVENGHILKKTDTWKAIDWDIEQETTIVDVTTYTWQGEEVTKVTRGANTQAVGDDERNMETIEYTHGDGICTMKMWDKYDAMNNGYSYVTITEKDGKYSEQEDEYYNGEIRGYYCLLRNIQKEDLSVTRPNTGKDLEGFCPEMPISISVKDRVAVTVRGKNTSLRNYGFVEETMDYFDGSVYMWYVNMDKEHFFDIRHEDDTIVCYDTYDRPVYVLKNGLLIQEYLNEDLDLEQIVPYIPDLAPRKVEAKTGMKNMTVITYHYNDKGWCTGQTIAIYDKNGEVTMDEYTNHYDPASVSDIRADEQIHNHKVIKNGHIYILRDGHLYTPMGIQVR